MVDFIIAFGFVAILFMALVIPYLLFITIMFVIYKATGGKLSYWRYLDLW